MKIRVTMKCPDALDSAISKETFNDLEVLQAKRLCQKWFKYGEYITVIVDTEKETCVVEEV